MHKQKLVRFINKYYLNGTVNSVVLKSKLGKLLTRFISGDKTLLGELELDKWQFEDSEVGIYDTEQLLKLLSVLDDDVNVSISKAGDKAIALKITDTLTSVNYMLSDVSIINEPPPLKDIPEFELDINVTPQFINKFIAGEGALIDVDNFTIITNGSETKVIINYASINTHRVTIPVATSKSSNIE